jgi:N-acetylglucosaminyl-diphospho-decaprenol L-rhamnosyltransferase
MTTAARSNSAPSQPARHGARRVRRVAALIVTYNSADVIEDCIRSIAADDSSMLTRVVVADNASTDATLEVVRRCAPDAVLVVLADNRGYAAGVNAAASVAGEVDAVLVLNADIRVRHGALAALVESLDVDRCGIVAPKVRSPDGRVLPSIRRDSTVLRALGEAVLGGFRAGRYVALGEMVTAPEAYVTAREADWVSGCAFLVDVACLRELGGLDETFFHGSEETEFCQRARDAGWTVWYTPAAEVVHLAGDGARSPALRPIMFANRLELHRRRRGPVRAGAFRCALLLNEILRLGRGTAHRATAARLLRPGHASRDMAAGSPAGTERDS